MAPGGAWQVTCGVGAVPPDADGDGVTMLSPGGQVVPGTTYLPVFDRRMAVGVGEPLGTGVDELPGRT